MEAFSEIDQAARFFIVSTHVSPFLYVRFNITCCHMSGHKNTQDECFTKTHPRTWETTVEHLFCDSIFVKSSSNSLLRSVLIGYTSPGRGDARLLGKS